MLALHRSLTLECNRRLTHSGTALQVPRLDARSMCVTVGRYTFLSSCKAALLAWFFISTQPPSQRSGDRQGKGLQKTSSAGAEHQSLILRDRRQNGCLAWEKMPARAALASVLRCAFKPRIPLIPYCSSVRALHSLAPASRTCQADVHVLPPCTSFALVLSPLLPCFRLVLFPPFLSLSPLPLGSRALLSVSSLFTIVQCFWPSSSVRLVAGWSGVALCSALFTRACILSYTAARSPTLPTLAEADVSIFFL